MALMENGEQPATKADLAELREAMIEAIHDSETRLLTAFYSWAQGTQRHLWDLDRAEVSLRERLAGVDKRLLELELRPPGTPPQASTPAEP